MSKTEYQGIRDQVHGYVEHVLSDRMLKEIQRVLKMASDKHSIPVPLKCTFTVDDDGNCTMKVDGGPNLKIPAWDAPVQLSGQMRLFTEDERKTSTKPPKPKDPNKGKGDEAESKAAPAEPDDPTRTIPESELAEPEVKAGGDLPDGVDLDEALGDPPAQPNGEAETDAAEPLSPQAAANMEKRTEENQALLERAARGEIQLDASAKAAIKAQLEAAGAEVPAE